MIHWNRFRFAPRPHHVGLAILLLAAGLILPMCSRADSPWDVTIYAETGSPGGWVQVRENEIEGTRLHIDHDLDANEMTKEVTVTLTYAEPAHAARALKAMNGRAFGGKKIKALLA